ncbi:MAG: PP2C family protein-serine/threonine phosphatase [Kofleriaceae bacterium]
MLVELGFQASAVPFVLLAVGLAALALVPALVQGDPVVRLGFALIGLAALPWAAGTAAIAAADQLEPAVPLARAVFAPLPLVGSGLLMALLGVAGRIDDHRRALVLSLVINLTLAVVCASTSTVVASLQRTVWGLPYPRAGGLYGVFIASIPVAVGYGVWATRGATWDRLTEHRSRRVVVAIGALAVLSSADVLLTYGWFRIYPVSWLPSLLATGLGLHAMVAGDLLRSRGLDRAAAVETVTGLVVVVVLGIAAALTRRPAALAIVTGAGVALMITLGRTVAQRAAAANGRGRDPANLLGPVDDADPATLAAAVVRHVERDGLLREVRVWAADAAAVTSLAERPPASHPLPPEVRRYLTRHARTLPIDDLASARLGALRPVLVPWLATLGGTVVVPLCERDHLVGLITGAPPDGRVVRDPDRRRLDELAAVVARAMTVAALRREVEDRADLTREVALADAVRQARAGNRRVQVAGVEVAIAYQPAARVAGDLWFTGTLPDHRAVVVVGDVAGRGISAALVSAAVVGACQGATGSADATMGPHALLARLHRIVAGIDGGRPRVTAAAVVIEPRPGGRQARIAIAGHRGGYLVRATDAGPTLVPVTGRGAPLGEPAWRASETVIELVDGDLLVLVSDGVTAARGAAGHPWGERRLQRLLRQRATVDGVDLAATTLAALDEHLGEARRDDDLLVVAIAP